MLVRLEVELPRDARYVGLLRDVATCVLRDLGAPATIRDDVETAVGEACANVVRHAVGTREYHVCLTVDDDKCEIEVGDLGPGLPALEPEIGGVSEESGRGLNVMRALMDELEFLPDGRGTRLRLTKRWPGFAPTRPRVTPG